MAIPMQLSYSSVSTAISYNDGELESYVVETSSHMSSEVPVEALSMLSPVYKASRHAMI